MYTERLKDIAKTPIVLEGYKSSWAQYTLILDSEDMRNTVQKKLEENGIPTMVYYPIPLHKQIVYKDYDFNVEDLKTSENLCKCVLSLPMHPYMNEEQVDMISKVVIKAVEEYRKDD